MAQYVTKIRTEDGDLPVDYNSLANLPQSDATLTKSGSFADAKAAGDKINKVSESVNGVSEDVATLSDAVAAETTRAKGIESGIDSRLQVVESAIGETGSVSTAIAGAVANAKAYTDSAVNAVSLTGLGVTATVTELNYVDGVKYNIQTQLNAKANSTDVSSHTSNKENPHSVTLAQLGVRYGAAAMSAGDALTTGAIYLQYE